MFTACTTGAMVFGDVNNYEDSVAHLKEDKRAYHVLDYITDETKRSLSSKS